MVLEADRQNSQKQLDSITQAAPILLLLLLLRQRLLIIKWQQVLPHCFVLQIPRQAQVQRSLPRLVDSEGVVAKTHQLVQSSRRPPLFFFVTVGRTPDGLQN
jgi:hypothetical protein